MTARSVPVDLEAYWMPFSANREGAGVFMGPAENCPTDSRSHRCHPQAIVFMALPTGFEPV